MMWERSDANCMTIVVGRKASSTGHVILGHNEDDTGRFLVRHGYVPPAAHDASERLPCEEGRAAIPQIERTCGFYWSEVCGAGRGLSTSDLMINDNGVCVVSDGVPSREDGPDEALLREGGIAYNLRRVVAERAKSARDGMAIIRSLVETWGYAPSGRIYIVADAGEAFVFQLVKGRRCLAARVPDDAVAAIPNHYVVHSRKDAEEVVFSPDLVSYALERGWAASEETFDFYEAFQSRERYLDPTDILRQDYALRRLTGRAFDRARLPFAARPDRLCSVRDVIRALSCHYEGTSDDVRFGPGASPHNTPVMRICRGSTVESTVVEFDAAPKELTAWTAFGRPCQQLFLPLHPLYGTVDAIDRMEDPAAALQAHLTPERGGIGWRQSGWQALRDFGNMAEFFHSECESALHALQDAWLESRMRANRERTVSALVFDAAQAEAALAETRRFAAAHFRRVEVSARTAADGETCLVSFRCDEPPREETLLFGLGCLNLRTQYARATPRSLVKTGEGLYQASFPLKGLFCVDTGAGTFECFLGGNGESGRSFAGMTLVER